MKEKKIKLDLACGNRKRAEDWIGIDVSNATDIDIKHDLNIYPWPFENNSVDEIYCSHYAEHIPHLTVQAALKQSNTFEEFKTKLVDDKDGLFKFFEEIYRVLKPGAKATIIVPYYMSVRAFGDPTHERYLGELTFYYLNREWRELNKLTQYPLDVDFDLEWDIAIDEDLLLKSEDVRNEAFKSKWNAVNDIIMTLTKR